MNYVSSRLAIFIFIPCGMVRIVKDLTSFICFNKYIRYNFSFLKTSVISEVDPTYWMHQAVVTRRHCCK